MYIVARRVAVASRCVAWSFFLSAQLYNIHKVARSKVEGRDWLCEHIACVCIKAASQPAIHIVLLYIYVLLVCMCVCNKCSSILRVRRSATTRPTTFFFTLYVVVVGTYICGGSCTSWCQQRYTDGVRRTVTVCVQYTVHQHQHRSHHTEKNAQRNATYVYVGRDVTKCELINRSDSR